MRKMILSSAVLLPFIASKAFGSVVYDNTGLTGLFDTGVPSIYFDDATTTATVPYVINQLDLGYTNTTDTSTTFDVLVQFYNDVNYSAAYGSPVGTNPIGSPIVIPNETLAADSIDETGYVSLVGPDLPTPTSGTVGFELEFVNPGQDTFSESNIDSAIQPIFRSGSPVTGSSSDDYAYDYLDQSSIVGDDVSGDVFAYSDPSANIYAAIGASPVPEPASLSLLALGTLSLLSRGQRRRSKNKAENVA